MCWVPHGHAHAWMNEVVACSASCNSSWVCVHYCKTAAFFYKICAERKPEKRGANSRATDVSTTKQQFFIVYRFDWLYYWVSVYVCMCVCMCKCLCARVMHRCSVYCAPHEHSMATARAGCLVVCSKTGLSLLTLMGGFEVCFVFCFARKTYTYQTSKRNLNNEERKKTKTKLW